MYFVSVLIFIHLILFQNLIVNLHWITIGIIVFLFFLLAFIYFLRTQIEIQEKIFIRKIFWFGLFLRFLSILLLYHIGYYFTGTEFEVGASDSKKYHIIASGLVDYFKTGNRLLLLPVELDDYGFIYINSFIYLILDKSTIALRMVNAFVSAITIVFVYKYMKLLIEDNYARLSSITTMLYPVFLYYTGVHMKESILVLSMLLCLYYATLIFYKNDQSIKNIAFLGFAIVLIFSLRFSLGISTIFTIFLIFTFSKKYNKSVLLFLTSGLVVILLLIASGLFDNLFRVLTRTGLYSSEQLAKSGSVSNVGTLFFFFSGLFGPFPGLVDIPSPSFKIHSTTLYQIGGLFYLILFKLFFIIGSVSIIKNKVKRFYPLLGLYFINLVGLSLSAVSLDIRYQTPNNLILFLISAIGFRAIKQKNEPIILLYFIVVLAGSLFWNYFRLLGRGLI